MKGTPWGERSFAVFSAGADKAALLMLKGAQSLIRRAFKQLLLLQSLASRTPNGQASGAPGLTRSRPAATPVGRAHRLPRFPTGRISQPALTSPQS
jgi:hypothetical protein